MRRIFAVDTKKGYFEVPFDSVCPTQNTKTMNPSWNKIKKFIPVYLSKNDLISFKVMDVD